MRSFQALLKPAIASSGSRSLLRFLSSSAVKMADLAAGKKAAAIRAVDDYVKVNMISS